MPYVSEVPDRHRDRPPARRRRRSTRSGIKGAGEAGVIPGAAVFAAAIEDAEGFPITSMPISPSDLFELRRTHKDTP